MADNSRPTPADRSRALGQTPGNGRGFWTRENDKANHDEGQARLNQPLRRSPPKRAPAPPGGREL